MTTRSFLGTIFEVPERKLLNIIEDALIIVGADGTIESVLSKLSPEYNEKKKRAEKDGSLIVLQKGQYILPGLIDLHVHAPQWPQLGKALDRPLEEWLNDCTFPLEAKYADIAFATEVYDSLVPTLLANGTTTAVYYATVHLESSIRLAEICLKHGQRAVVGRVAMDLSSHSPAYYRDESPEASEKLSKDFINAVRGLRDNSTRLVEPAVVPRFIPTCSDEALQRLGNLAKEHACYIQTHCSESDWEHHHVLSRFNKSDAFALDSFGLVTPRTVLAHCNYLSDEDMDLIKSRGAAVAHCPLSNLYFSDAVFPLKKALDRGLHVGLGTDISGGPSPSLMEVSRFAVGVSRALDDGVDPSMPIAERRQTDTARVDHVEAFYVATTKGGEALGKKIGRIAPGYSFDAIVIDVNAEHGNIRVFPQVDSMADVFQKIVYNLTPSNIIRTFVGGRVVHEQKS